jgi:hypothetical protein
MVPLVPGGNSQKLDLNEWLPGQYAGSVRTWSLIPGQTIPAWLALGTDGLLNFAAPLGWSGQAAVWVEVWDTATNGRSTGVLQLRPVQSLVPLAKGIEPGAWSNQTWNLAASIPVPSFFVAPVSWSVTDPALFPGYSPVASVDPVSGQLTVNGGMQRREMELVLTDSENRKQVIGLSLNVFDQGINLGDYSAVRGTVTPVQLDVNYWPGGVWRVYSDALPRMWEFVPGTPVPAGFSLAASGVLSVQMPQSQPSAPLEIFLQSRPTGFSEQPGLRRVRLRVAPMDFSSRLTGGFYNWPPGNDAVSTGLNALLPAGLNLVQPVTWSSNNASVVISTDGLLSLTGASEFSGEIWVSGVDANQKTVSGALTVEKFQLQGSPISVVVKSGSTAPGMVSMASMLNDTDARIWQFKAGQTVPAWVQITPWGQVVAAPPLGTPTGQYELIVEGVDAYKVAQNQWNAKKYAKVTVTVVDLDATLLVDLGSDAPFAAEEPRGALDLTTKVPAGFGSLSGGTWSFLPNQSGLPEGLSLSPAGLLAYRGNGGFANGQEVFVRFEGTGGALLGRVTVLAVWPSGYPETPTLVRLAGGSGLSASLSTPGGMGEGPRQTFSLVPGQAAQDQGITLDSSGLITIPAAPAGAPRGKTYLYVNISTVYPNWPPGQTSESVVRVSLATVDAFRELLVDSSLPVAQGSALGRINLLGVLPNGLGSSPDGWSYAFPATPASGGENRWGLELTSGELAVVPGFGGSGFGYRDITLAYQQPAAGSGDPAASTKYWVTARIYPIWPATPPSSSDLVRSPTSGWQTVDLGALYTDGSPSGWTRTWKLTTAQSGLESGIFLSPNGMLTLPPLFANSARGKTYLYLDVTSVPPAGSTALPSTQTVRWTVHAVDFSGEWLVDTSLFSNAPGASPVALDLKTLLPFGGGETPAGWSFAESRPET